MDAAKTEGKKRALKSAIVVYDQGVLRDVAG